VETWSISDAAYRCGVSPHTVRYYERCGVIPPITRDGAGRRVFSAEDLGWVEYAVCLRSIGMGIADVRRYVEVAADPDRVGNGDHVAMLESHRARMKAQRTELDAWIDVIERKLARLTA
jgi:DNA-binding transcriptional MerR regulator